MLDVASANERRNYYVTASLNGWTRTQNDPWPTVVTVCPYFIETEWCIHASINKTIISSDNSFSPVRRQAIIGASDDLLLIETLGTHFGENLINKSVKQMNLKMSAKC